MEGRLSAVAVASPHAELLDFVARELATPRQAAFARICVPMLRRPFEQLHSWERVSAVWQSDELEMVGYGEAFVAEATGPGRVDTLRAQAEAFFSKIETARHPDLAAVSEPRLFGGLAFSPGVIPQAPWGALGDARFVAPVVQLCARADQCWLEVVAKTTATPSEREGLLARLRELLEAGSAEVRSLGTLTVEESAAAEDAADWIQRVEAIRAAIERGEAQKIVAAREVVLQRRAVDLAQLVQTLRADMTGCIVYGVRSGRSSFLGASPERLIAKEGTRIRSHALAGSIEPGVTGRGRQAAVLFDSAKDRWEHQLVVDHLVAHLRPRCRELTWPDRPTVRELRNVLHLETPVVGELADPHHVLDLVADLHPTPAVGGVPTALAQRWIIDNEPAPRGWYSGPIGWFDAAGNGDFAVAIRSAAVAETDAGFEVRLHSGAGIVSDSESGAELGETELKLSPMRSLLDRPGVVEP